MICISSESWDTIFFKNQKGGPKGGPPEVLFKFENFKIEKKLKISKLNRISVGPPFGPPFWFLKNIASQLSLEKNH